MAAPSSRCGFVFEGARTAHDSCCYREVWGDRDRCVWHADSPDPKPLDELLATRETEPNRARASSTDRPREILDGARVPGVSFPPSTEFDGVFLRRADLSGVDHREGSWASASVVASDLSGADLRDGELPDLDARMADLGDTDLRSTRLTGADFFDATLDGALLAAATLEGSDLRNCEARDAVCKSLTLENALLDNADFSGADLRDVSARGIQAMDTVLTAASLEHAVLDDATLIDADLSDASLEGASLDGANLMRVVGDSVDFQQAVLEEANLLSATLSEANLLLADLADAYLQDASLSNAHLVDADFRGATLDDATATDVRGQRARFSGASLQRADFGDANLRDARFDGANATDADFTDASLQQADLTDASIERAVLTQADLFDADLRRARFYGAIFAEARINDETEFGDRCIYDPKAIADPGEQTGDIDTLTKAAGAYQELEKLCRENALSQRQSHFFVRRQDINLAKHRRAGRRGATLRALASRTVLLYGESPWRVLGVATGVILGCGLLYPVFGVIPAGGGAPLQYGPALTSSVRAALLSIYFSALTFTTGFSGFHPQGLGRVVATFETLAGAVLLALLVFVFGRRATR